MAIAIWLGAPFFQWGTATPFATAEKRIGMIAILFLAWLLKFLIIDLAAPHPLQYKDKNVRKKLLALQNRFDGALQFLKKTQVQKQAAQLSLSELPWYLLMGQTQSGKTAFLANAGVNFILQRRLSSNNAQDSPPSEHCDWWITRDVSLIDVPGKYLLRANTSSKFSIYPILWQYFIRLLKKHSRKHLPSGLLITLPLPEFMLHGDTTHQQAALATVLQRVRELELQFAQRIPCQLIITKCDLLPGFSEFFNELTQEEISQTWGIHLPDKLGNKLVDATAQRFDALIKKLNAQLLFRLHHERNPMARPYIKDFPLQVERLKESLLEFIKTFAALLPTTPLHGIYLTSALQKKSATANTVIEETVNNNQRALQIFKEPTPATRGYFIKQFLTHHLAHEAHATPELALSRWKQRAAYAASISAVLAIALLLGRDFEQGVKQTYAIQNHLSHYRLAMVQSNDQNEHLIQTITLLNVLQPAAENKKFSLDFSHLVAFYSHKSQKNVDLAYRQALQTILLPTIKNYLEDYLKNPVNKETDNVYAALKTYLMLGDTTHFDANYLINTLQQLLPSHFTKTEKNQLVVHLNVALKSAWQAFPLNNNVIQETRHYFTAMPGLALSYAILRNTDGNNAESLHLAANTPAAAIFINNEATEPMPLMYTAKAFSTILTQEATLAAQETMSGNWVLGEEIGNNKNPALTNALLQQLRSAYVAKYIDAWESLLNNLHLETPTNLAETDKMLTHLISNDSPLLTVLRIIRDNTYFEPIASSSTKLLNIGSLLTKDGQAEVQLRQIFASLRLLHEYLQTILASNDEKKSAFYAASVRMQSHGSPDVITQLRLVAEKSPEPIKHWLDKIANQTWHFLMQDASSYIDTSWQMHPSAITNPTLSPQKLA